MRAPNQNQKYYRNVCNSIGDHGRHADLKAVGCTGSLLGVARSSGSSISSAGTVPSDVPSVNGFFPHARPRSPTSSCQNHGLAAVEFGIPLADFRTLLYRPGSTMSRVLVTALVHAARSDVIRHRSGQTKPNVRINRVLETFHRTISVVPIAAMILAMLAVQGSQQDHLKTFNCSYLYKNYNNPFEAGFLPCNRSIELKVPTRRLKRIRPGQGSFNSGQWLRVGLTEPEQLAVGPDELPEHRGSRRPYGCDVERLSRQIFDITPLKVDMVDHTSSIHAIPPASAAEVESIPPIQSWIAVEKPGYRPRRDHGLRSESRFCVRRFPTIPGTTCALVNAKFGPRSNSIPGWASESSNGA